MAYQAAFSISHVITQSLSLIERARGFLEAIQLSSQLLTKLQHSALVREAHHTTHIEGTRLTLDQSEKLLSGQDVPAADPEDARELLNYRAAFDFVAAYLESKAPITEGLIREIHSRLVTGVRGDAAAPGEYRRVQNYVVNSHNGTIVYTPPPAYMVPQMMAELIDWLANEKEVHPVLVAGIAQFQLVHIHPFLDGNGRAARLLSTLCLFHAGYDFKRLFTLSQYYDRDRPAYYHAIQSVRDKGMDLTSWLEYFVEGLVQQLQEVQQKTERVAVASQGSLSERERQILALGVEKAGFSISDLESQHPEVSRRTWQRHLHSLVERGLLIATGTTNRRRYHLPTANL